MITLSSIDIAILILYFAAVLWIGYVVSKQKGKAESFLLMGRRLTLPLFVGSLISTWYGGIIGVGEISYSSGLYNWVTQGFFWYLAYIVFALFLAARLRESNQYTLPDQLEIFYGKTARKIGLVLNFLNVIPVAYVLSLGILLQVLFGWPLPICILIGGLFSMFYTILGGFTADVYTDMMQFVFMCIGVALIIPFSFFKLGGWQYLTTQTPASHFSLTGGEPLSQILIWGFIAATTLVDPNFYQRCYAAEKPAVARKGILLSVLFWMMFDLCTTFAGIYARATFPNIDPKHAYFYLANAVFPPVFKGIFITGMIATVMSTVDSYLFVGGTTIGRDLYQKILNPAASERRVIFMTRMGILFSGCLAIFLAFYLDSIKTIWKLFGSITASALLVPLMIGFWYRGKKEHRAGVASMLGGLTLAGFFYIGDKFLHLPWCETMEPLYPGMAASLILFILFNRRTT